MIDLRSDTVTRPTPAMREAIAAAVVGDDVFGDDPTVASLEARVAALLDKEAGLFMPSGTMANQVAVRAHTEPGDEIIVEASCHIVLYEGGGASALSGVSVRAVAGERGLLQAADVVAAVRAPGSRSHFPVSRLLCVENTANAAGGRCYDEPRSAALGEAARGAGLASHLDGARLWNAAVALSVPPARLAAPFDSVSVCFSKGLGCPVGSVLCGPAPLIARAHRFRKMFGGGLRQAGVLAAAAHHALDHHVDRLADDHARAQRLAAGLGALPGLRVDAADVETNLVYVDTPGPLDAAAWVGALARHGVAVTAMGARRLRFVTHLDVDDGDVAAVLEIAAGIAAGR